MLTTCMSVRNPVRTSTTGQNLQYIQLSDGKGLAKEVRRADFIRAWKTKRHCLCQLLLELQLH